MFGLRATLIVALPLLVAVPNLRAEGILAARIEAVIGQPQYRQAHWGLLVVDSATGETIYALNPEHMLRPASTTKLFTCAAALAALGSSHRFETPVYQRGTLRDGRLKGDLILVAQGDLTLGGRTLSNGTMAFRDQDHTYANGSDDSEVTDTDPLAGLNDLAKQVAATGIRHVDGDVLIDERLFEQSRGSGSGPQIVTPIVVNDNVVDFIITPGKSPGDAATVKMRPEANFLRLDAQLRTSVAGKRSNVEITASNDSTFVIRGDVPVRAKPLVRHHAVNHPGVFGRALFIEALQRAGIVVRASALQPGEGALPGTENYAMLPCVAKHVSAPFTEVIKVTLKVSHNLYASTLPALVAVKKGKRTVADGLAAERGFLAELGASVETISFGGGAGGANADHVTPTATVQLLRGLSKRTDYAPFLAALPVLGEDGTLASAVSKESPARGKVFAKTGTLIWHDQLNNRTLVTSKALAGTMVTAKGRALTIALFVNNVPLPRGATANREGRTLGKLCEVLFEHTP